MAVQRPSYELSDEEIRAQPVSELRVGRLFDNYLRERKLTRTTEMLFDRVDALEKKTPPIPERVGDFGFKATVFKRSFIDGVNSLIVSAQGWAEGQEDFLLKYFGESLRDAAEGRLGHEVDGEARAILSALEEVAEELREQGLGASAFAITGSIGNRLYEEVQKKLQNPWDWYRKLGTTDGRATYRFIGAYAGTPVVGIEAVRTPTLFAVDLAQFGTLTRYGEGPNFDPEFRVTAFSDEEARKVLIRQPNLILDPPPVPGNEIERIRQLQLRVGLELWETYKLDVKDPGAVIARPLAAPLYE